MIPEQFLVSLRSRKSLLFALSGFLGGAAGSFTAEVVPNDVRHNLWLVVFDTALWTGVFAAVLTLALFWAQEFYQRRRRPGGKTVFRALKVGSLSGMLSGAVAQIVFSYGHSDTFFGNVVFRSLCWGLMGALLGWRLAASVPNLGMGRGIVGGGLGGFAGGLGFVFSNLLLPETLGRMIGVGVLGLALGLGIVVAERLWREASLEIIWAPKEITTFGLGAVPLRIGGGDDHVYIHGLPPHVGNLALENGKVQYTDMASGQRTEFRDGSRLKIGRVEMIVHAHA